MRTKRIISVGPNPGVKYVAKIIYAETIGLEKLSEIVAETSAMTEGDIYSALIQSIKAMGWLVTEGHPVDFGKFGRIYPQIRAKAMESYEEVTADTIYFKSARLLPSMHLRKIMSNAKLEFHEAKIPSHAPKP